MFYLVGCGLVWPEIIWSTFKFEAPSELIWTYTVIIHNVILYEYTHYIIHTIFYIIILSLRLRYICRATVIEHCVYEQTNRNASTVRKMKCRQRIAQPIALKAARKRCRRRARLLSWEAIITIICPDVRPRLAVATIMLLCVAVWQWSR